MKHKCHRCEKVATWYYMPSSDRWTEEERYSCDTHVSRGCSCNIDPCTGKEDVDIKGRRYPCCEYMYSEDGWDVIDEDDNAK